MAGSQGNERGAAPSFVQGIGGIDSPSSGLLVVSNLTGESASTPLPGAATTVTEDISAAATVTKRVHYLL